MVISILELYSRIQLFISCIHADTLTIFPLICLPWLLRTSDTSRWKVISRSSKAVECTLNISNWSNFKSNQTEALYKQTVTVVVLKWSAVNSWSVLKRRWIFMCFQVFCLCSKCWPIISSWCGGETIDNVLIQWKWVLTAGRQPYSQLS